MTMALRDAIDYTALGWVKPELDETLRQARLEVEAFVEDPTDSSRMRFCASYLHQVQGTLRMVELYAPAMVAEEMEQLAEALQADQAPDRDAACASLMRGTVLLPDYLERLQGGHRDIPIVLLPLLNELRAARGATGLSESVLFAPDLDRPMPVDLLASVTDAGEDSPGAAGPVQSLAAAMDDWPESGLPADGAAFSAALEALLPQAADEPVRRMLWVAQRAMHALGEGAVAPSPGLHQAFASVVREARRHLVDKDGFAGVDAALEATRQLLFHVTAGDVDHPALQELRSTFDLDQAAPSEAELVHAHGSLSGRNRALLDTVAAAVKEDLLRVKDALDLHLRTGEAGIAGLESQVDILARVGDTLGMLGLGVARTVVLQQRDAVDAIVRGDRAADEDALLDIAGSLLYVDASLDEQVARLGVSDVDQAQDPLANESRKAVEVIAREAIANFADARQAFVAFVETSWDHEELVEVPRLLNEVGGAMRMLQLQQPADLLTGVRRFTETELLARRRVPNGRQLDTLADTLASLEYYLEALGEHRGGRQDILDIARSSLETLGYWPLPDEAGQLDATDDDSSDFIGLDVEAGLEDAAATVAAFIDRPQPQQPAPAPAAAQAEGGFEATGDEIDDEIREVFLEEFAEEIDNLATLLPAWRDSPDEMERLRPIRRVFHTLKGSGRLVGARTLGEFSWKIESLLNRVLEGGRPASPAVLAVVDHAFDALPVLQAALKGEHSLDVDLASLEEDAERITGGDEAMPRAPLRSSPAGAEPEVSPAAAAPEQVPAQVDELLLEILDAEVVGHLAVVESWLEVAALGPATVDDSLLRAVHTMNGAFAMAEVPMVPTALSPAESWVRRLLGTGNSASEEAVAAMQELVTLVRSAIAGLKSDTPGVPVCEDLAARWAALRDTLPEPPSMRFNEFDLPDSSGPEVDAELLEAERLESERFEAESLEAERLEAERLEAERLEAERLEAERLEAERLEAERLEAERLETERVEAERAEAERLEVERLEVERAAAERLEAERLEAERLEAERAEAERLEVERLEAERLETERLEAERLEAERLEAERAEAERLEVERTEAERAEAERLEAERLEAERLEAERLEAERLEAERLEAERLEAERLEAERLEAERLEAEALESTQPAEPTDDTDQPLDLSTLDIELVDIFIEEAGDLLDHSDGLLTRLSTQLGDRESMVGLQRDLHTLKGGASMAGLLPIGELGHAMETLLESVVEGRSELARDGMELLQRGYDQLHVMVTRVRDRRAISSAHELVSAFEAPGDVAGLERPEASVPTTAPTAPRAPKKVLDPLSAPMDDAAAASGDDSAARAPQEQVRVRADLLDRLVNSAGEVAIYRARLEQQLGAFRGAMTEMEQTNMRLRDQLRRLDIETEAQIIARYQRETETTEATFDPLELDRFSTLQQLSRALAESAADMNSLQGTLDDLTSQYETLLTQQSRVSSELQEGLMRTRMVPFESVLPRLRRVVRQAAGETGKQVQLHVDGAQGELDRNVLERMTAPLEHMLRNAVVHGLEDARTRRKAGKHEEGEIRITVRREGSEVVLLVSDDGHGLDRGSIRRRAEERGLVAAGAVLTNEALDALIFEPGFSTADEVSRLAGRGVGMDVVTSEVRQLGGTLETTTGKGEGTTFTLRLPQTLAVTQAVFVQIGDTSFAVPIASVRGVGRISREAMAAPDAAYEYGGEQYVLHDLGRLVGQAPARAEGHLQMPLLLIGAGGLRAAVAVDQIIGNREIVVKPVGPQVASVPGIFGATIMGDGSVRVILDVAPLVRRLATQPQDVRSVAAVEARPVPLVMVVDDSVTMRKVTGRVLERNHLEVVTARDGIDAIERMDERVPDLMLLDIEMPRMDGYELATHMKADPRLRDVPIVMITSRTGEKHRQRAFEIGVERYLGKPYQENELIHNVFDLLGMEQPDG
ncbi:Hpt domain-containing protein [Luteimonas sp. MJ293]|uniref:Hpt domain-containing protein n=1 Tax=Luteimonas sp. MJ146 TaxID=3129240 RepID=UPI0031B9CC1E